jgi:predicted  nucleic acid-binding Zn-ribbon protein
MKQNVKLLEEINELSRQLHRLDLETRTELKKKKELKKMKETGNTALDDDLESVHKPV